MELYLLINISVSAIILALLRYGNGTNLVNYYISIFGILIWFVPYSFIASFIPNEVLLEPVILTQTIETYTETVYTPELNSFNIAQLIDYLAIVAIFLGFSLFIKQIIKARALQNSILNHRSFSFQKGLSEKYQAQVYSSENAPSGILLGLRSPKIVIASSIQEAHQLNLIISHEKTHLKRHDNYRLIVLEFVECLFWWNPLVRALAQKNKFFIEAICDEQTSKKYGLHKYIEDFASLILRNHKVSNFILNSTATSNKSNNMSRLILLKENRVMTLKRKLIYTLTLGSAISAMIWNTFAIASGNDKTVLNENVPKISVNDNKQLIETLEKFAGNKASFSSENTILIVNGKKKSKDFLNYLTLQDISSINVQTGEITEFQITTNKQSNESNQGALVNFDLKVKDRSNKEEENLLSSKMSMWVDFDKKASFKISDNFKFSFKVSDLGEEQAFFDMEIVEVSNSGEKVVSNPKLQTSFTQEAMIEIDNFQVSPHAYAIKFTPEKASRPQ